MYNMYNWNFSTSKQLIHEHAHTPVQMMFHLPYRAVGRDWYLIYSTFKHGISLRTLYRNMMMFENEDSPILLVVRDEQKKVLKFALASYPGSWRRGEKSLVRTVCAYA